MSSHGDSRDNGSGKADDWNTSSAQIICSQVVPDLDGVLITMSSGRNTKPSHRVLSRMKPRYTTLDRSVTST
jgi:hypothetical protein